MDGLYPMDVLYPRRQNMNIMEREEKGVTVFVLDGRVDTQGAVMMDKALQAAVSQAKYKLVMDMTDVTYISSAALRSLADVLTKSKKAGGDLKLVALSPKILRVFRIIGFDKYFSIFDTVEAALIAF
jgi:anti-anti-sigma factor